MLLGIHNPLPKGIGNYVDDEGIVRLDDGTMAYYNDPGIVPDISTTVFDPNCDPNAAYPVGSVCWGIQQGVDAKALATSLANAANKPCMGTPIVKGVSNCLLAAGTGAFLLFMMAQNR